MTGSWRPPRLLDSFNYAFEGIIHVLRTQRNMRIHFGIAFAVLVLALVVNVTKLELIALLISVTFVLWTGRINNISSAMGPIIDMARTPSDVYRGLARPILTWLVTLLIMIPPAVLSLSTGFIQEQWTGVKWVAKRG